MSYKRILGCNGKMRMTMEAHPGTRFRNVSIPASARTCPNAGQCKHGCYAHQGRMGCATAQNAYRENLAMIDAGTFEDRVSEEIREEARRAAAKGEQLRIRIHDTGDFFSEDYLAMWVRVAERFPEVVFYAYTKMVSMVSGTALPRNLRIVFSYGGTEDAVLDAIRDAAKCAVIGEDAGIPDGFTDGSHDDFWASEGMSVAIRYHGPKSREWTAGPQERP